jgi:DNA polymerase-3 subunit delta
VRHRRGSITDDAAGFLVEAVGTDLRSLAAAVEQLVGDFAPERITTELVRRYYDGRAEVKSFDIADAAIEGRVAAALERLRWALAGGVPAVFVISACASGLRSLARLQAAPRGLREADLAREVGAPPFRLKVLRTQLRGWDAAGLARAIRVVAQADLDVKGGVGDPDHALERMVLAVARGRAGGQLSA